MRTIRRPAVALLALAAVAIASATAAPSPWREWSVASGSHPHDVAPSADGKTVYYTAQFEGALGILDIASGKWRHVDLGDGSSPHGVITGPDGDAWITDQGLNELIRYDPGSRRLDRYRVPTRTNSAPHTAAFAPNGVLWFTASAGWYGRVNPRTRKVDVWPAPRGQGPYGVTVTPNGTPYFASLAGNYVGKVDPRSGAVKVLEPPTKGQGARRVWTDSRNRVWVTYWSADKLGMYDPRSGWREWNMPGSSQPYAVYVDEKDIVWVTDFASNAFVRFDPRTERFTTYRIPTRDAAVRQLLGIPGQVWGAESARDKIVVFRPR